MTAARFVRAFLVSLAVVAGSSGCSGSGVDTLEPKTDVKHYYIGAGSYAREFRLDDGTRCLAILDAGLTCEWRQN